MESFASLWINLQGMVIIAQKADNPVVPLFNLNHEVTKTPSCTKYFLVILRAFVS